MKKSKFTETQIVQMLKEADAAINIAPTMEDKVDICQNAIDLAIVFGEAMYDELGIQNV